MLISIRVYNNTRVFFNYEAARLAEHPSLVSFYDAIN